MTPSTTPSATVSPPSGQATTATVRKRADLVPITPSRAASSLATLSAVGHRLARVPRGAHARRSAEGIHLQASVIRHGRDPGGLHEGPGLQARVVEQGHSGLVHLGDLLRAGEERHGGAEDPGDLPDLVPVRGGKDELDQLAIGAGGSESTAA